MPVDVCASGQSLELDLDGSNFEIGDERIDDAALFPGAAKQEVYRDDFYKFDIPVVAGVNDAVLHLLDGNVVGNLVQRLYSIIRR